MTTSKRLSTIQNITSEFISLIRFPDKQCRDLNYLLVMPASSDVPRFNFVFQIGIGYVSSALKASGRNVFTLNLDLNRGAKAMELLKSEITKNKIDVVMTGGMNIQFRSIKEIVDIVKEMDSNIITVVGGVVITTDPTAAMEAFENADYGVIGEAEITVNALAYALETADDVANIPPPPVPGTICFRNGEWLYCEDYPSVSDLSILPYPDFEGFDYGHYLEREALSPPKESRAFINSSRSCTNKCTFCFSKHGEYRRLNIDDVFRMIDWLVASFPAAKHLYLSDEVSFSDPEYAIAFSRRIQPYGLTWRTSLRVPNITKEMLIEMKAAGCSSVLIGIESADNDILKSMRKGITIEQIEKAIGFANDVGIAMKGYLIFGDLEETADTVNRSINWYRKNKNNIIVLTPIIVNPGTHLYEIACKRNIILDRALYIKNYSFQNACVNVSKLSQSEYCMLPYLLRKITLKGSPKLVNAKVAPQRDFSFNVTGLCPFCSAQLNIDNCQSIVNIYRTIDCLACKMTIVLNPIELCDLVKLNNNVKLLMDESKMAIWAITPHNYYSLTDAVSAYSSDNIKFINSALIFGHYSDQATNAFLEKRIFTPEIICSEGIETIIVPNNPMTLKKIRVQCAAQFPHVKRIVHITELL